MTISTEELAGRVNAMTLRLLRRVRAVDAGSSLSTARLSALSALVYSGPRTVGELAAVEQVAAPTMSRLVTALERDGYVRRQADDADGRRVRVVVTPAGVHALEAERTRRAERTASVLGEIDAEDRDAVLRATEALEAALDDGAAVAGPGGS